LRLNTILKICLGLLLLSAALSRPLLAASSDLLVIIEPDGKHYLAQRTLTTDAELLVLDLPVGRRVMQEQFSGPEKLTFSTAHKQKPDTLSLWSGAVMTRYRHQYNEGLEVQNDGTLKIDMPQAHFWVSSDDASTLRSSMTWVLPEGATVISFTEENADPEVIGSWISNENTVSYTQSGGTLSALTLHFALFAGKPEVILDACVAVVGPTDKCSPDIDLDDIPDYRDVCLPTDDTIIASDRPGEDDLGCDGQLLILLNNVNFQVGNSYLDAASREALDRVAIALQRIPEQLIEVSAHTDNDGSSENNLRLSQNRAAAVRHYLMLRGVGPNQINSVGYGERLPLHSNETSNGRRDNRRVELKRIN
jgi:outer membrane protein OmpA-like peptidoglycan-associated protein